MSEMKMLLDRLTRLEQDYRSRRSDDLRDRFAGQIAAALVATLDVGTAQDVAKEAYLYADALIEERERR